MFQKFTDPGRHVVVLAQEEARRRNHNYIGTEHLLLGLTSERDTTAVRALHSLGISPAAVRGEVEQIVVGGERAPSGQIPFTPQAKKVLEMALQESIQLRHNHIGTGHLLLGLLREGEGIAAQVLIGLGADLDRTRRHVVGLPQDEPGAERAAAARSGPRLSGTVSDRLPRIESLLKEIADRLDAIERRMDER